MGEGLESAVREALKEVRFRGLSRDIVSFGFVDSIEVNGEAVRVHLKIRTQDGDAAERTRADASTCALLLQTVMADSAAAPGLAERLDSLALTGPRVGIPELNMLNLVLAGIWESQGRVDRALAAVRRRRFVGGGPETPAMLREEGRLALLAGDTVGAIWAYGQYLRPRGQAEPAVRVLDDVIRAELASLAGEPVVGAGRR